MLVFVALFSFWAVSRSRDNTKALRGRGALNDYVSRSGAILEKVKSGLQNQTEIDETHMRAIVQLAKEANPSLPFAAAIVDRRDNSVICTGVNSVHALKNPTLHAEIATINNCSQSIGYDRQTWHNFTLYTTGESCPMCMSAIEWARIGRVVYGTSIDFLVQTGWHQITISSKQVNEKTIFNSCEIVGGILESETNALFANGPPHSVHHLHNHELSC